ncbi:MAG: hypothetical protein HGA37_01260 [Lentimicrobium sp.]|nr:hypothetical protein [Lentimicrobium sp.]
MATGSKTELRFAIMCNSLNLQQWQYDVIDSLINSGKAIPVAIILPDKSDLIKPGLVKRISTYHWTKLLFRKYYQYFFRPVSFRKKNAGKLLENLPEIFCITEFRSKYSEYFFEYDIKSIQKCNPDFILKFGFGIIRGEILNCTPYGVWSFHHGDEQKYRGVPPALYEILFNDPVTGSVLQRLTETLDGGIILRKGYFPTINHSWKANLDQAIRLSKNWPADVCAEIIAQNTFPSESGQEYPKAPIFREPTNFTFIQFFLKEITNKLRFHLKELFFTEKWQTGILKARPADIVTDLGYNIDNEDVTWFGAKGNDRYFADSFALKEEARLLLLFEDYNYKTRKAVISSSWFTERESLFSAPVKVLEEPWHLSYPFTFRYEGQIWCIPESISHGSVELYRYDPSTGKLLHHSTLLSGVAAADPTLVFHQNHWYLFFTPADATNVELHIWHAESFQGPFEPHELNPVKSDITNSRPAGPFFILDKKLYRPAQDCSLTYGGRVVINEVKLLSDTGYLEMSVSSLVPPEGFEGLHTISFAGDYLYFDCKKPVFSFASFQWQLKRRLHLVNPNPVIGK